jgi:hypothetical protein
MRPILRFVATLLTAFILTPVAAWLLLVCTDLVGLENCMAPRPGWLVFALVIGLSITLPPVLHSWPDTERPLGEILRENSRASLFTFCLAAAAVLFTLEPFLRKTGIPSIMAPVLMMKTAFLFACPVLSIATHFARTLLPRPTPDEPAPASMKRFGLASAAFIVTLALQPFLLNGSPLLVGNSAALIAIAWIFFELRREIRRGLMGFAPAWAALTLVAAMRTAEAAFHAGPIALVLTAALALCMALSWIFLMHRDSREWLC